MSDPISLRLPDPVLAEIDRRRTTDAARGGDRRSADASRRVTRAAVVSRDLARFYALLSRAERTLRSQWSEAEWALAMDALAGAYESDTIYLTPHAILDSLTLDHAGERFGVDGGLFREEIAGLTPLESVALVDAAERERRGSKLPGVCPHAHQKRDEIAAPHIGRQVVGRDDRQQEADTVDAGQAVAASTHPQHDIGSADVEIATVSAKGERNRT